MSNPLIHDLMTLLYVYQEIVKSDATMTHMKIELQELVQRFARHGNYFSDNALIVSYYEFFKKVVDSFCEI